MRKTRQVLLVKLLQDDGEDNEASSTVLNSIPLGTYSEILDRMSGFNTSPDGSNRPESFGVLYGPGLIVQMPMVGPDDLVMQVAVSMNEEEIAWPVLMRVCRELGWKMMDPSSGRTFGG